MRKLPTCLLTPRPKGLPRRGGARVQPEPPTPRWVTPGKPGLGSAGPCPEPRRGEVSSSRSSGPRKCWNGSGCLSSHVIAHIKGSSGSKAFKLSTPVCCRTLPPSVCQAVTGLQPCPQAACWMLCCPPVHWGLGGARGRHLASVLRPFWWLFPHAVSQMLLLLAHSFPPPGL